MRHSLDLTSTCIFCGELREQLGFFVAENMNANKLALCFNQDDYARLLLGFYISDDITRLAMMNPLFPSAGLAPVQRILPLSDISQKEVALYSHLNGFKLDPGSCPHNYLNEKGNFYQNSAKMLYDFEALYGFKSGIIHTFKNRVSPALLAKLLADGTHERRCQGCGSFFVPPEKHRFSPGILCSSCMDSVGIKERFR